MVVSYEFFGIALTSKYKRQMCANVSQEIVYVFSTFKSKLIY